MCDIYQWHSSGIYPRPIFILIYHSVVFYFIMLLSFTNAYATAESFWK